MGVARIDNRTAVDWTMLRSLTAVNEACGVSWAAAWPRKIFPRGNGT
jgi:hypothetical protein